LAPKLSIGIAGFGNVGREFVKLLLDRGDSLGIWDKAKVVFIADSKGVILDDKGLEPGVLASALSLPRGGLGSYQGIGHEGVSVDELLDKIDILVDITPSIYRDEPPQLSWFRRVLRNGGAVVTADKAPLAMNCSSILSGKQGRRVFYKATVMAGTPLIDVLRYGLRGRVVERVRGALNGTSNYVLTLVEEGKSLSEALYDAQMRGYAEPDASIDLRGLDLAAKASIIACTLGNYVNLHNVHVEDRIEPGIEKRVAELRRQGKRLRYILEVCRGRAPVVRLSVLEPRDALWSSVGVLNVAEVVTEEAEPIVMQGPGAGPRATASSLLSDLLLAIDSLGDG